MNPQAEAILGESADSFSNKTSLISLWQEISENFYPERADFTYLRTMGESFANHLADSSPVLLRRELGNSIGAMLRPAGKDWGSMVVHDMDSLHHDAKQWLEWAWQRERAVMYERSALLTRAAKEGDHDWATFGQCVIRVETRADRTGLLYRSKHLRDVAWREGDDGTIDTVYCKESLPASILVAKFGPERVHPKVLECANDPKRRLTKVNFQHIIVPAEQYEPLKANSKPKYASLIIDSDNHCIMEERGSRRREYVIPRWQTVSGSPYAFSPSTIVGLPDARTIQSVGLTLLEAGERAARPPMVATQDAVRSDMGLFAGGITWVDADYDERLGEALRPLTQGTNMPIGFEMSDRRVEQLRDAFYLNQITGMPMLDKEMTAYEASQHVQNYIRQAMPLFEPMEYEYNGGLCEETFDAMFWMGGFGSPLDIPKQLRGTDIEFQFRTPLHDAMDREKGTRFQEMYTLTGAAAELDPTVITNVDVNEAYRDSLTGMRIPAEWLVPEEEAKAAVEKAKQQQSTEQAIAQAAAMGESAELAARGAEAVQRVAPEGMPGG